MMNGRYEAYVNAAVEGEAARLASAHPGERNQILFKSSASLAGLGLLEGQIIQHLKPVAENIGLHGKEFYSTLKSGVKAGHARPRVLPVSIGPRTTAAPPNQSAFLAPSARQTSARQVDRSAFFAADEGPPVLPGEIRRHAYRRSGLPVRIKIKHKDGPMVRARAVAGTRSPAARTGSMDRRDSMVVTPVARQRAFGLQSHRSG